MLAELSGVTLSHVNVIIRDRCGVYYRQKHLVIVWKNGENTKTRVADHENSTL